MRPALIAATLLSLLLASTAHAQGEVRFYTNHLTIGTGTGAYVVVENGGPELRDVAVQLRLSPGLRFFDVPMPGQGWSCAQDDILTFTCRTSSFNTGRQELFGFTINSTDGAGGLRSVRATLTARNLQPKVVDITVVTAVGMLVTTGDDFGPGSLRAAIEAINESRLCGTGVACFIGFTPPLTIRPLSPLPPIRKCNVYVRGNLDLITKSIVLSGERASYGNGLEVRASCAENIPGVTIESLAIHSWPWNGIYFEAPAPHAAFGQHRVNNCHIGTDPTGFFARPNGSRGIVTDSPYENLSVMYSIISGNGRSGIALFRGARASISSSKIGTNLTLEPLGNGASGVFSIGVPVRIESTVIASNAHAGLAYTPGTRATVASTPIFDNGGLPIDANLDGRSPSDGETDGILNAPRITGAFYDPASGNTIIRGVVRLRKDAFGTTYVIEGYIAFSQRGDIAERLGPVQVVEPPADGSAGDVPFDFVVARDLRGSIVALQTFVAAAAAPANYSSEISEGVVVR